MGGSIGIDKAVIQELLISGRVPNDGKFQVPADNTGRGGMLGVGAVHKLQKVIDLGCDGFGRRGVYRAETQYFPSLIFDITLELLISSFILPLVHPPARSG